MEVAQKRTGDELKAVQKQRLLDKGMTEAKIEEYCAKRCARAKAFLVAKKAQKRL
jgi:hypothetical protein